MGESCCGELETKYFVSSSSHELRGVLPVFLISERPNRVAYAIAAVPAVLAALCYAMRRL